MSATPSKPFRPSNRLDKKMTTLTSANKKICFDHEKGLFADSRVCKTVAKSQVNSQVVNPLRSSALRD